MGKRTAKSGFGASLKSHANDETNYGMEYIDLPAGIKGGVARLVEAKLGEYKSGDNQGENFLYLAGVVLSPKKALSITKAFQDGKVQVLSTEEVEVEGQRTSCMEPLCNTTKANDDVITSDEHVANALNELRKLGADTSKITTPKAFNEMLEALKEAAPTFKFGTSSKDPTAAYPTPRVWEGWYGTVDIDEEEEEDVDDDTEDVPDDDDTEEDDDDSKEDEDDESTLWKLGEWADSGDSESESKLTALASEAELDPDDFETWAELAEALPEPEQDDEDDDEGDIMPEKDDIIEYKPPKSRKNVQCKVTAVFASKETCNLKNLDTGASYKDIAWERLSEVE